MTTTKKAVATKSATTSTVTEDAFPVLEAEPEFRKAQGRAKTGLRKAIEGLEINKSIVASEDGEDERVVGSIRQKAQAVRKASVETDEPKKFRVRVDVGNRVIVTRVPFS